MGLKKVRAPVRIDFGGGTTDIYPFTHKHGGAVLNAGINKYVVGSLKTNDEEVRLEYTGHTPTSSGLGTSGVMNLVWLALISQIKLKNKEGVSFKNKLELAEKVYGIEQAMGLVGGKQDQYAAAFGGINFMEFKGDKVIVKQLKLSKKFIKEFEDKLVLVYTGKPHFSGTSNKSMIDNLKKGKNVKNMLRIKHIAIEMKNALLNQDLAEFAHLMNEETKNRGKLHKSIIPKHIKKLLKQGMENGALGAKVCGSGGGGSLLFLGDKKRLKKKFGKMVIDFRFDDGGLKFL